MMIERPLAPYDGAAVRAITAEQASLIEERRDYLRVVHREQFPGVSLVCGPPPRTIAGAVWQRELGFGKLALVNRGAVLLDFWTQVQRERDIPPSVLAWESHEGLLVGRNWHSTFYRTVFAADQLETERSLNDGLWIFATVEDMPGFSAITEQEARRFYHHIGGVLPHVGHMSVEHIEAHWVGGRVSTVLSSVAGGVPPYAFAMSAESPTWMRALTHALISVAPPVGTPIGSHVGHLVVTDSLGLVVRAPITIILDW